MSWTQVMPQIITAASTLIAAFGALAINKRSSTRDREADYNRELCRDLFVEFFKSVHTTREVVKRAVDTETYEFAHQALLNFREQVYESTSLSVLVAPAIEEDIWNVYQCVLEEASYRRGFIDKVENLGDVARFGVLRSVTNEAMENLGSSMRSTLGLKAQQKLIRSGRMEIVPIEEVAREPRNTSE